MYLRSIMMKGFKSFPERTRLDFSEGVSVIVGPNGSGKSNVTDAILWALGEQSPNAVRGQAMQDVIFSGGHGLRSRTAAEVEVVLDNSDFVAGDDFAELSITRRLERSGEGEYRLNGARCRLVDVLESLSDTGLGKEMHSVVSQGRVEGVIHSRPHDRRLLIEEAAGLGKHRKRRRRAELKLARTTTNLDRALDVEREARSRLRPLKRQAEAADLHARLERQSLEARLELARDSGRAAASALAEAERGAESARADRDAAERRLTAVAARRKATEEAFAAHGREREALSERLFAATSALDGIEIRLGRARDIAEGATAAAGRAQEELERLEHGRSGEEAGATQTPPDPIPAIERELRAVDGTDDERLGADLERLEAERHAAAERRTACQAAAGDARSELEAAEAALDVSRASRREADGRVAAARLEQGRAEAEVAAADQLGRYALPAPGGGPALASELGVAPGYELAVAAVLGELLRAGLAEGVEAGAALLDGAGDDGGVVVLDRSGGPAARQRRPPVAGAEPLLDFLRPGPAASASVERLLADVWVVESLDMLPREFDGVAVTRSGRALFPRTGELRQAPAGGEGRTLARLARRDELAAAAAAAGRELEGAEAELGSSTSAVTAAEAARDLAERSLRDRRSALELADAALSEAVRSIERRRAGAEGPALARRAQLEAELRFERSAAERADRERDQRVRRTARLHEAINRHVAVRATAERGKVALDAARDAVAAHRESLRSRLAADEHAEAGPAAELRECAHEEADVQAALKRSGEQVTATEVRAQQARDAATEIEAELVAVAEQLGLDTAAGDDPRELGAEERGELEGRVERLARRREQLGPVNPLAAREYADAVAHVEELESQRGDLEGALAELEGVIQETDRRIGESFETTFEATARNFEEVVEDLFPGGRGRLRLVGPEGPRPVVGGEDTQTSEGTPDSGDERAPDDEPGVEVEVTPAGKSTRRLSLLSGGEKSLVALAFLFAVFLARPCPFYVLDEVEAALDDINIDRFLKLVRRCADRAQFIVVTHQKRTMDVADRLYGVSMGHDGVSKVVSRRLTTAPEADAAERPHAA